jgi:hypothetical protein
MNYPIISIDEVFHIGFMDIEHKESNSLEGSGLSVSTEPDAWIEIAKLGGRPIYSLKKTDSQFLDCHALTDEQVSSIIRWGTDNGYIELKNLYRVMYYDDEMESEVYSDYENESEAKIEAEGYEVEPIVLVNKPVSTEKLKKHVNGLASPTIVFDLLCAVFVEEYLQIDGAWWFDTLDPSYLSAPRGVIFNKILNSWQIELADL